MPGRGSLRPHVLLQWVAGALRCVSGQGECVGKERRLQREWRRRGIEGAHVRWPALPAASRLMCESCCRERQGRVVHSARRVLGWGRSGDLKAAALALASFTQGGCHKHDRGAPEQRQAGQAPRPGRAAPAARPTATFWRIQHRTERGKALCSPECRDMQQGILRRRLGLCPSAGGGRWPHVHYACKLFDPTQLCVVLHADLA